MTLAVYLVVAAAAVIFVAACAVADAAVRPHPAAPQVGAVPGPARSARTRRARRVLLRAERMVAHGRARRTSSASCSSWCRRCCSSTRCAPSTGRSGTARSRSTSASTCWPARWRSLFGGVAARACGSPAAGRPRPRCAGAGRGSRAWPDVVLPSAAPPGCSTAV